MRRLTPANAARRSSPRPLLLAGLVAAGCLIPAAAHAELHLAFGTRWQPLRYTKAIFPNAVNADRIFLDGSGFQSTSLDPYLALFFAQKYGAVLSLDMGYGKNSSTNGSSPIRRNRERPSISTGTRPRHCDRSISVDWAARDRLATQRMTSCP